MYYFKPTQECNGSGLSYDENVAADVAIYLDSPWKVREFVVVFYYKNMSSKCRKQNVQENLGM